MTVKSLIRNKRCIFIFALLAIAEVSPEDQVAEECDAKNGPLAKLRENSAKLNSLVEKHICKMTEAQDTNVTNANTKDKDTAKSGSCNSDFEQVPERSKRIVVCNVHSGNIDGEFKMEHISETLCTHVLISGFYEVKVDTLEITGKKLENYTITDLMTYLKSKKLKVWLSIGADGTLEPKDYSTLATTEESRTKFIKNVMGILVALGMDGFSPRWRYPVCIYEDCYKPKMVDSENSVRLIESLSAQLRPKGLSLVIYTTKSFMYSTMFKFKSLTKFVDYWLIVCYNNRGHWDPIAGESSSIKFLDQCLGWYRAAIQSETAILGLAPHYLPLKLMNSKSNKLGANIMKDTKGNATLNSFRNICNAVTTFGGKLVYNESSGNNAYWTKDSDWVSIETTATVRQKMEFVTKYNLSGVFLEHLRDDDFDGTMCKCGKYPVLRTMNEEIRGSRRCFVPLCPTAKPTE
ncbi:probable chitinase 10 [Neocloeon triangulifer]|uniref:probable chitinase 10 n=1 Tax=Neocloeon triangulifer TaxID=2078957 RepID=UPI00286ECB25|nr:probable chitinase 10 [Neocloeon triangulifer]